MTVAPRHVAASHPFEQCHATYRRLKDAENAMTAHTPEDEKRFKAATGKTDIAFEALLAEPTIAPPHLAAKLAAVIEHYDVFCFGIDRDVGERLFGEIIAALASEAVQS